MSDVKWIKITTDVFDDEKMCAIETLPDGFIIELVWFKILCLAGKCNENGFLMISKKFPYTDEMLSKIFRMSLGDIKHSLEVFQELKMIDVVDDTYMVTNWEKHQNVAQLENMKEKNRDRQRRFRERQKLLEKEKFSKQCAYCGEEATGLDHIIPKSKGGGNEDNNLVACCLRCNSTKNAFDLVDFLNNNDFIDNELVQSNEKIMRNVTFSNVTKRYENNVTPLISISYSLSNNNIVNFNNIVNEDKYKYILENSILLQSVRDWMEYKDSLKPKNNNFYLEIGLRKLLVKIIKTSEEYGADEVSEIIDMSIMNGWKGILWKALDDKPKKSNQQPIKEDKKSSGRFSALPKEIMMDLASRGVIDVQSESINVLELLESDIETLKRYGVKI